MIAAGSPAPDSYPPPGFPPCFEFPDAVVPLVRHRRRARRLLRLPVPGRRPADRRPRIRQRPLRRVPRRRHTGRRARPRVAHDRPRDPIAVAAWVRVYDRVRAGEMPPPKKPRPAKADADAFLAAVATGVTARERERYRVDGRATVRRLNRGEFENTLRDLLDLPWLRVQDLLPDDGRAGGYTKSAAALDVSPVLLAKYADAIDKALEAATAKYAVPPELERKTLYANHQYDFKVLMSGGDAVMLTPDKTYDATRFPMPSATDAGGKYPGGQWSFGGKYKGLGEAEKGGAFKEPSTVGMTRTFGEAFGGRFDFAPLHPGRYRIGVSAWSYWWDKGEVKPAPRTGAVGVYCGSRVIGFFDAPSLTPTWSETEVDLEPTIDNSLRAAGASFLDAHVYFSQGQVKGYSGPGVAIDKLFVEGPLYDEWPPPSHRHLFGTLPVVPVTKLPAASPRPKREVPQQHTRGASNGPGRLVPGTTVSDDPAADARRLLGAFLPRAFRRPVAAAEVERYAVVADARTRDGACFEDALKAAYKIALLSPDFLFLNEPAGKLDGYAVAARLSYFLWNSCPDDALLAAAKAGRLADPAGLKAAADRLLADPKANRFHQDFLDQWLDLRDFDATSPDKQLYPDFQPNLEDAMRREPAEFFREVVRHDMAATHLFATSVNVVNQRLAEHYGIPGVAGTRFRRVDVDPKVLPRGGLLTTAAVCKVTANGTTTSPVKRGAWVMKKVLGTPPQAPPPDVPAVEPDVKGATTIREQLAKHRENPGCASCHAKFDPPGFALESYDPIGGWRDFYRATEGKKAPDFARIFRSYLSPDGNSSTTPGSATAAPSTRAGNSPMGGSSPASGSIRP
ncbi:hypothetical protein FRUB_09497 [Fimbriiglobus ruber]|uniref:DUF1592 domain-containing protein n=1 Tax=Fimbriiglobus ruber TaxID=1908690 RepID=A0A225DDC7_9BACT|nr:hypothetical protein FRUB_09497 [Fimbriiglobus ruber]